MSPAASAGAAASAPIPSRSTARHSKFTSPTGSAAAVRSESSGLNWERLKLAEEALLYLARQRRRVGKRESARQLRRRQPARQLEQRERVATRLGDDPVAHALVQSPGDRRVQQRAGITVTQTPDHLLRKPRQLMFVAGCTHREHQPDPLRQQAARNERERLRGDSIEPLRVIDEADQRRFLGHLGQQAEHRQPDEEAVRRLPRPQAKRRAKRIALRTRQLLQPVQHRRAQLLQPGERELHLGLNARRSREATSCRALRQVFQQRGLSEPRLAAQDQHLTLTRPRSHQQPIKRRALGATTGQHSSHVPARERVIQMPA